MQDRVKWFQMLGRLVIGLGIGLYILGLSVSGAFADWKEDVGTFRIGVVVDGSTSQRLADLEPFRLAVEEKLGIPAEIIPTRDLSTLIRNHAEGRNEYAILSASAYGAAWALCECIEPLVVAASFDGATASNSILISRKDGTITSPETAIGSKINALGKNSILGYAFPVYELQQQKINLLGGETQIIFSETAEAAISSFAKGEGDALIGWVSNNGDTSNRATRGTLAQLATIDPSIVETLRVIWTSSPVPHRMHSIRKNLPGEPKRLMGELLAGLYEDDPVAYDAIEPDYSGGFKVANQRMFEKISEFAKSPIPAQMTAAQRSDIKQTESDSKTDAQ